MVYHNLFVQYAAFMSLILGFINDAVNGVLQAYEFKWNVNKKHRITSVFSKTYGIDKVHVITPNNYMEFVTATI